MEKENLLMVSDLFTVPLTAMNHGIKMITKKEMEQLGKLILSVFTASYPAYPQRIESTRSSSVDYVVCLCESVDFPGDDLLADLARVCKPGGTIFLQFISESAQEETVMSSLERKLLLAGFVDMQFTGGESLEILGKKSSLED